MLKKLFQQVIRFFARLFFSRTASPLNFLKGRRNHRSDQSSLSPGVQQVSSDSMEPFACSIAFLEKKQSLLKIKVNKDDSIEMEGRLNTKSRIR